MSLRISSLTHPRRAHAKLAIAVVFVLGALAGATLGPGRHWAGTILKPAPFSLPPAGQSFPAEVIRVFDGDTFQARVRLGSEVVTTKVRLRGIDTPERDARCSEEAVKAEAARRALAALLAQGHVRISHVDRDKYGRMLAVVSTGATPDVSVALLRQGVGRPYEGGHRAGWCGKPGRDWSGAAFIR